MPAPKSLSLFTRASIPIRDKSRKSLKHSTLIKARFASPARANYGGEASGESPQITRIKSISEPRLRTKTLRNGALSWASDKCFEFLRLPIAIVIVVRKDGREGEREREQKPLGSVIISQLCAMPSASAERSRRLTPNSLWRLEKAHQSTREEK